MENTLIFSTLAIGWPVLIIMSLQIAKSGKSYTKKLKDTSAGKLMKPTIIGWLFGLYSLGIVATAYMLEYTWYYVVLPIFATFLVVIVIIQKAVKNWEKEATEIQKFYENLEKLVEERTAELKQAHKLSIAHEKEIQKLKDQFVFIAAHELKTPVTAIRWSIESALDEKTLTPELENILSGVQSSNQRLITLVDDLLNVARIEAGTIKIDWESVKINEVIQETLAEMQSVFAERSVTVNYNPKTLKVWGDSERIKQVLVNLFSNATKYNKEGGSITIETEHKGDNVEVRVADSGIGIADKDMATLFTKFGRIKTEHTTDIEGTGLGLYLSKEIVTALGGEITATSTESKGTTFTFTLPTKDKTDSIA